MRMTWLLKLSSGGHGVSSPVCFWEYANADANLICRLGGRICSRREFFRLWRSREQLDIQPIR